MTIKGVGAGKGSVYREVDKQKYDENYDRIFKKKPVAFSPKDIDECIDIIIEQCHPDDTLKIAATEKENLIMYHFGLGMWIRNQFGLWDKNNDFFKYMKQTYNKEHPDDLSMIIIVKLWEKLRSKLNELEVDENLEN